MTVGIGCSSLLSVYLFRFQLHLFIFAVTMILVYKDYQNRRTQCTSTRI